MYSKSLKKPKILFHASPTRGLTVIAPRSQSGRGLNEGDVVFGTPEVAYASMFLVQADDSWTKRGRLNGTWYFICADKQRLMESDKGGSIYSIEDKDFEDPIGAKIEWIAKTPQAVKREKFYASGVRAMMENKVVIRFVNKSDFEKITPEAIKELIHERTRRDKK